MPEAQEKADYYRDGLLYCGRCNTPKQSRVIIFGKHPPVECSCIKAERDAMEAGFKRQAEQRKINLLRGTAFSDAELRRWTFSNDDNTRPDLSDMAWRYVNRFTHNPEENKGLLLYGPTGTGKTFYACCIANALIDRGISCLATCFTRVSNTLFGMKEGKQEYIDSLNAPALLVLDDLAAERNTEYMQELVFSIIDARYRAGKPVIITTNLTAQEFNYPADMQKKRIYSRLFEMCDFVEVNGKDRRKEELRRVLNSRAINNT